MARQNRARQGMKADIQDKKSRAWENPVSCQGKKTYKNKIKTVNHAGKHR